MLFPDASVDLLFVISSDDRAGSIGRTFGTIALDEQMVGGGSAYADFMFRMDMVASFEYELAVVER